MLIYEIRLTGIFKLIIIQPEAFLMAEGGHRSPPSHEWQNCDGSDADSGNESPDPCNVSVACSPPHPSRDVVPPRLHPEWNKHDEDYYIEG